MVNRQQISEWVAHPEMLNNESLYELRKLLATYPYFQTARILYLKNLYLLNAPEFKDELKKGALYVADLSILFYYIEGEKFAIHKHQQDKEGKDVSASDRTLALINDFLNGVNSEEKKDESSSLVPEITTDFYTSALLGDTSSLLGDKVANDSVPPLRGQDLIDSFIEEEEEKKKSSYAAMFPDEADEEEVAPCEAVSAEETPVPPAHNIHSCTQDTIPDDEIEEIQEETNLEDSSLSETLAKIYIKQHKYDKALEIIKKLNLNYPKKNAYFADQIRFLEKLIINTKSK